MTQWTHRCFLLAATFLFGGGSPALAQRTGSPAPGPPANSSPPSTGTRGATTTNNTPSLYPNNNNSNTTTTNPDISRPIFLSGKVIFDDGSPANSDIGIERVCGGNSRLQTHTDGKGRFSFQLGGNEQAQAALGDASESSFGTYSRTQDSPFGTTTNSKNGSSSVSEAALWGCDLRASYPGYRSDIVTLAGRRSLDDPNLGTLILHRLANVQGTTISVTSAAAPKAAQKNFDKALQLAQKQKFDEAEKHLLEATTEYPKYATAWFMLGQVQQRQNKNDDARKSYQAAVEADHKFVSPYNQLALLSAQDGKWAEVAQYSKQAIELNPVEFPSSFWYNTVSNYNLNKLAEAAKSGQALLKLDTAHHYPEVNRLLADISLTNKQYEEAAAYLHTYLAQVPKAKDAEMLKQQLLKIEEANAQTRK